MQKWVYGIFGFALIARLWGIDHGLPFTVHPDEQMLVRRGLRMGSGDLNPYFFYYPSFSIYCYFILDGFYYLFGRLIGAFSSPQDMAIHFIENITGIYVTARVFIATVSALGSVFVFKIAQKFMEDKWAFVPALLWALNPLAIDRSKVAKPDILMASLVIFAFFFLVSSKNVRGFVISGIVLGLSISSKYISLLCAPAFGLAILFHYGSLKEAWKPILYFGLAMTGGFLVGTPFAILDYQKFLHDFMEQSEVMKAGMSGADGGTYFVIRFLKSFFSVPSYYVYTALSILGFSAFLKTDKKWAGVFMAIVLIPAAIIFRQRLGSAHYFLFIMPLIFIVIPLWLRHQVRWLQIALVAFLISHSATGTFLVMRDYSREDTRVMAGIWIHENLPSGAVILMDTEGPRLPRSKEQLEKLYLNAKEKGHIKADYFKLLLQAKPSKSFVLKTPEKPVELMPPNLLKVARSVQDSVPIMDGLGDARAAGVEYIVYTTRLLEAKINFGHLYPGLHDFFGEIYEKGVLLKEIKSSGKGPDVWIYCLKPDC